MNCKFCTTPLGDDDFIVFCGVNCQLYYSIGVERMKTEKISLPEELFKAWLEDETNKVENMNLEELSIRIIELEKIKFEQNTRLSVAHIKRVKLQGANWIDNSKSISDPNFVVDYDKDPRKRKAPSEPRAKMSKEEKQDQLNDAAGIDAKKLKEAIKAKMLEIAARKKAEGK